MHRGPICGCLPRFQGTIFSVPGSSQREAAGVDAVLPTYSLLSCAVRTTAVQ